MILLSFVFSLLGRTVAHPGTGEELQIRNLLSGEGLQFILTSMLENFTGFAPLGLVLAMMLGIGLAEKVGLLDYAIRKTILKSPPFLLTYTVVFTGILGNLASDAAVDAPAIDNWYFNIVGEAVEEENTEELPNAKKAFFAALITGVLYWAIIVHRTRDSPLRSSSPTSTGPTLGHGIFTGLLKHHYAAVPVYGHHPCVHAAL